LEVEKEKKGKTMEGPTMERPTTVSQRMTLELKRLTIK
jgi:hypothetical protein